MPKYTRRFKTTNNGLLLSLNKDNKKPTKEQQIELAYQQAEQFKQDAIMEEEMGLDL